jgi:hypothetical protein
MQVIVNTEEKELAVDCLLVVYSFVYMLYTQSSIASKFQSTSMQLTEPSLRIIISLYTALWYQLCFPHILEVRCLTHETPVTLEGILNIL